MKKIISLFIIVAFIVFSLSCYSTKNVRLDADSAEKGKKVKIPYQGGSATDKIKRTFKEFGKLLDIELNIAKENEWTKLIKLFERRHSLTHPTRASALNVSEEEYHDAALVFEWFSKKLKELNRMMKTSEYSPK